jgi:hypothetical protein
LAVQLLGEWLDSFKERSFNVSTSFIEGDQVNFGPNTNNYKLIRSGSVALVRVTKDARFAHYILLLSISGEWLEFFDPCPEGKKSNSGNYEYFVDSKNSFNLRIHRKWLVSTSLKKTLVLGPKGDRECLLVRRHEA